MVAHTAAYISTTKVSALGWIIVSLSLAGAACLLVGFMTPVIAIAVSAGTVVLALSGFHQSSLEIIVLTIAVALLGPGAFSLDARMFGRREIFLPNTHRIRRNTDA
ncbi:MAG TPA: hypothetical protein VFY61_04265 [Pyrinomonadaceae bacterium]|nr:hypothetical protein [Pyrinomonadaceae bacterium]